MDDVVALRADFGIKDILLFTFHSCSSYVKDFYIEMKLCRVLIFYQFLSTREMRLAPQTVLVRTIRNDLDVDGRLG